MLDSNQVLYAPASAAPQTALLSHLPQFKTGDSEGIDPRVLVVTSYIEKNIQRNLSVGALARLMCLSPSRFQHLFKSEIGISPAHYVRARRMRTAQRLLESTPLSIKEIMHRVGLTDASHFVRDFKKTVGQTPTQYRMSMYVQKLNNSGAMRPSVEMAY